MVSTTHSRWVDASIAWGAGFFILALILSAVFDPTIRILHALQVLIYVAVIVVTRRGSAWGFGAGTFIAALWNYMNIFVTTFIKAGLAEFSTLLHTGQVGRPDLLIAVVAAAGHFVLIAACLVGFLRARPGVRESLQFLGGGVAAVAYFVAIIAATGPQYVGLIRRVFGL